MHPAALRIQDYTYHLPDDRIARYPLPDRDASKLLIYKDGTVQEQSFIRLPEVLPTDSLLVFNQTKVVNARLLFQKPSGGIIEVFCLEPHQQYADISTAMAQHNKVWWHCLVGGAAKWKPGIVLTLKHVDFTLSAKIVERCPTDFIIELSWDQQDLTFSEILKAVGKIPLPPYLNRTAEDSDAIRYQTLFASEEGSVAAPTASLHFTDAVLAALQATGIDRTLLTLHVGAGTFKPVKADVIGDHSMHAEWLEVSKKTLSRLLEQAGKPVIAVGTTALRTLESLYWMGCKAAKDLSVSMEDLAVSQWEPYEAGGKVPVATALQALLNWMEQHHRSTLVTKTQILIAPGYRFKIIDGLITNFHQPQSTLLLLVAALIGEDWKRVYDYALAHDFRFLSYGDSSLLWNRQSP